MDACSFAILMAEVLNGEAVYKKERDSGKTPDQVSTRIGTARCLPDDMIFHILPYAVFTHTNTAVPELKLFPVWSRVALAIENQYRSRSQYRAAP